MFLLSLLQYYLNPIAWLQSSLSTHLALTVKSPINAVTVYICMYIYLCVCVCVSAYMFYCTKHVKLRYMFHVLCLPYNQVFWAVVFLDLTCIDLIGHPWNSITICLQCISGKKQYEMEYEMGQVTSPPPCPGSELNPLDVWQRRHAPILGHTLSWLQPNHQ